MLRLSRRSWISYGLGSENNELPDFVTVSPTPFHGGVNNYGSAFLPAIYQGTPVGRGGLPVQQAQIAHITPAASPCQQRMQLELVHPLNQQHHQRDPADTDLEARIRTLELAFRIQSSLPELQKVQSESRKTQQAYGLDQLTTQDFGYQCLLARCLIEQGVRLVQVTHQSGPSHWDQHADLLARHPQNAREVDQPIAALLKYLKQRGLLDDTLVLWGGRVRTNIDGGGKGQPASKWSLPQSRRVYNVDGRRRCESRVYLWGDRRVRIFCCRKQNAYSRLARHDPASAWAGSQATYLPVWWS